MRSARPTDFIASTIRSARSLVAIALEAGMILSSGMVPLHAASPPPRGVELRWRKDPTIQGGVVVEVSRLPAWLQARLSDTQKPAPSWESIFRVMAKTSPGERPDGIPAMSGRYTLTGNVVRFEPAFPLTPGVLYEASFDPGQLAISLGATLPRTSSMYRVPAARTRPSTRVTAIYPSASRLPENLLKFYLHFSGPMSRGHIYDHIRLVDRFGKTVELPFLEIDEELWDPTMTRLTLFLDPGRIKRGVRPLEEVGPSLEAGSRYTLILERNWQDGDGLPLRREFRKTFTVTPPDREPPDPQRWTVSTPKAGSRDPVRLYFYEPMDHALLERVFKVQNDQGHEIPGRVTVGSGEQQWSFKPLHPWNKGSHRIVLPKTVEDLAGNNIGKPFDVDLFERVDRSIAPDLISVPFRVH